MVIEMSPTSFSLQLPVDIFETCLQLHFNEAVHLKTTNKKGEAVLLKLDCFKPGWINMIFEASNGKMIFDEEENPASCCLHTLMAMTVDAVSVAPNNSNLAPITKAEPESSDDDIAEDAMKLEMMCADAERLQFEDSCTNADSFLDDAALPIIGDSSLEVGSVTEKAVKKRKAENKQVRRKPGDPGVAAVPCCECGVMFVGAPSMLRHVKKVHRADTSALDRARVAAAEAGYRPAVSAVVLTCPVCGEEARGMRTLTHLRRAHAQHPELEQLVELTRRMYHGQRSKRAAITDLAGMQPCPHCSLPQSRRMMRQHVTYRCRSNPQRAPYLRCSVCAYGTPHADRMEAHMNKHTSGERAYVCDICGCAYVSKAGLTSHTRKKHALAKRLPITYHECGVCSRSFVHRSRLEAHKRTHTGERKHTCSICDKGFVDMSSLRTHHRTQHLKQYRYHCERCGHGMEKRSCLALHRCPAAAEMPVTLAADMKGNVTLEAHVSGDVAVDMPVTMEQVIDTTGETIAKLVMDETAQTLDSDNFLLIKTE